MIVKHHSASPLGGMLVLLTRLFLLGCILIIGFGVIGYTAGWVSFHHDQRQERTTIEIETGEAEEDAEKVIQSGADLIEQAGDNVKEWSDPDRPVDD